jgi:hypothetical protein
MRLSLVVIGALLLVALPAVAQQDDIGNRLSQAGFKVRPTATADEAALLRRVPPRTMLSRSDQARRYYVLADPDVCKCVYTGDEQALRTYKEMSFSPNPSPNKDLAIRELDPALGQTALFGPPF